MAMTGSSARTPQKRTRQQPSPDMNVTPLVDVTLVLLIIMMVVAPSINEGEQLQLPRVMLPDEEQKDDRPIELTVAANGALVLEKERIAPDQLLPRLRGLHDQSDDRQLRLQTDSAVPYREVRDKLVLLQQIGFRGVQLKVEQQKEDEK